MAEALRASVSEAWSISPFTPGAFVFVISRSYALRVLVYLQTTAVPLSPAARVLPLNTSPPVHVSTPLYRAAFEPAKVSAKTSVSPP